MKYAETYVVRVTEADCNEALSAAGIVRYMQDAGWGQMRRDGPSYDTLLSRKMALVVSSIRVEFYESVHVGDKIEVRTWACEGKASGFPRCYEILCDGNTVAEASSVWAMVNTETHRLYRVDDVSLHYGKDEPIPMERSLRPRVPAGVPMFLVGEHTVNYNDVDMNGHMNNTRYIDLIASFLPELRSMRISSLGIRYCAEAPFGETLRIYSGRSEGILYFRTVRADGTVNVEAEVILTPVGD